MLDVSISYNRYKFIGHEFLTWLWFIMENDQKFLRKLDKDMTSLHIGNRVVLENSLNNTNESILIKGDDAGLEEGKLALKKGAVVIELNFIYKSENQEWKFTLKGESLSFSSLKVPETGPIESKEDIEGLVLEKAYLYEKAIVLLDILFNHFIKIRLSEKWTTRTVPGIKNWICL